MASNLRPKSNSLASKTSASPKPTFRRAPKKGKAQSTNAAALHESSRSHDMPASAKRPVGRHASSYALPHPYRAQTHAKKDISHSRTTPPRSHQGRLIKTPSRTSFTTPTSRAERSASPQKKHQGLLRALFSRIPKIVRRALAIFCCLALLVAICFLGLAYSSVFAVEHIEIIATEHVSEEEATALLSLPEKSSLLMLDEASIEESLMQSPWVASVEIERQFPHTIIVRPSEHRVAALAYIAADNVAWALSTDDTWIAPITLSVTVGSDGSLIDTSMQLAEGAQVTELTGGDAAARIAQEMGVPLISDIGADTDPARGAEVTSDIILAALSYLKGFSSDFCAQIKDISASSVESLSAHLYSGVEVSLGTPEDIEKKERIVTEVLAQVEGVTYINVRTPDAYTYRSVE